MKSEKLKSKKQRTVCSISFSLLVFHFLSLLLYSCNNQHDRLNNEDRNAPKVVEAKGYVLPKDSVAPPVIIPLHNVRTIKAGKPHVVPIVSNVYPVGTPEIILAG